MILKQSGHLHHHCVVTVTGFSLDTVGSGQLFQLEFAWTGAGDNEGVVAFDDGSTVFAPLSANNALTFGIGHPAEPLVAQP